MAPEMIKVANVAIDVGTQMENWFDYKFAHKFAAMAKSWNEKLEKEVAERKQADLKLNNHLANCNAWPVSSQLDG